MGSTSTITIAVANAMNAALGSPLTRDELRLLMGNNFVEETAEGTVTFGFETGVGPAVSTYGGMAILGDGLTLVYHHPFAEGMNVFIVIPPPGISSVGPTIAVITDRDRRAVERQIRPLGLSVAVVTKIDNLGMVVSRGKA